MCDPAEELPPYATAYMKQMYEEEHDEECLLQCPPPCWETHHGMSEGEYRIHCEAINRHELKVKRAKRYAER